MNKKVILIGFEYNNLHNPDIDFLPGIPIDLYQVYSFIKNIPGEKYKTDNITVFTDIKKDYKTKILKNAIIEGIVDSGLLSFFEDIKELNQYVEFKSQNYYNNFEHTIKSLFSNTNDKICIYYTGHAINENIIFPDGSLYSFSRLVKFISKCSNKYTEIMIIMDCCNGIGLNLPYVLNDNIYRLTYGKHIFVLPKIICISSSTKMEKSLATKNGSLFTRNLFQLLSNELNISLRDLLNKINRLKHINLQKVTIHASYPTLKIIWGWFYGYAPISVTIDSDTSSIEVT